VGHQPNGHELPPDPGGDERASTGEAPEAPAWHALDVDRVLERVDTSRDGLSPEEAARRLAAHGPNQLTARRPPSAWGILLAQFQSVVVLLLVVAAIVAFAVGDRLEAAAIAAVLLLNAAIGFPVELRARRAMEALLGHQVPDATVLRGGRRERIPAVDLVPGDVIEIEEGEAVPADARLLDAVGVRAAEAALTGESVPVRKDATESCDRYTPLPERTTMLFSGTALAVGHGRAIVVATGMDTELGGIGRMLEGVEDEETPLERRLDALGARLVRATLLVAAALVVVGVLRGFDPVRMLETGIALAIAAVPEGLPVVATIALAIGLRRMARRNAAVRRLASVEALGATTVVCTDKTGTLTAGEMTVTTIVTADDEISVTGSGYAAEGRFEIDGREAPPDALAALTDLLDAAALTPRARVEADGGVVGDPTDAALLVLSRKGGRARDRLLGTRPQVGEIPFTSDARMSASYHRSNGTTIGYVKGAPEAVLSCCTTIRTGGRGVPLDNDLRRDFEMRNEDLAGRGLRVIALAVTEGPPEGLDGDLPIPRDGTFLGLVGLLDPPAEGVAETIGALRGAGIRVIMITGDQAETAAAVARDLGMEGGAAIDGRDLAALDDSAMRRAVETTAIFSRTSPADKLRIVETFRDSGEVVAVLGDGVNDAAALKRADVGVAMGMRGTDVAKEVADLVLRDDRFPTITAAVEEGRVIFDNIRKFVFYLFSCNVAEVLVVAGGSLAGLPLPLLPLQILWLNLVTDTFPALALAIEPGEPGVMIRSPREPGAAILSRRFVGTLLFYATLITAVTLGAFVWGLRTGPLDHAVTMAFATLAFAQLFHLGTARARDPVLRPSRAFANRWALGAVALVLLLQGLALYWPPLMSILGTTPLSIGDVGIALGLAVMPAAIGQLIRLRRRESPGARYGSRA